MKVRTLDEQTNSLASYLPEGRVWASKNIANSVTRGLLAGLSGELLRSTALVEEFRNEILPDNTTLFLDEWERAVGIPDDCFTGQGTLEERRNDVLAKLAGLGVQTAEDLRRLALRVYGVELTIRNPSRSTTNVFPYTFNPTGEADPLGDGGEFVFNLSDREARFQIIIEYDNLPTAVVFPYTFPLPFLTREVAIIECLFTKLRPANVGFTEEIPIPAESPTPEPEPPGFTLQLNSLLFDRTKDLSTSAGSATSAGFTDTFSIALWVQHDGTASPGTSDVMYTIRPNFGLASQIQLRTPPSGAINDLQIQILDGSVTERQRSRWNGVVGTDWSHYVMTWDGTVGGLKMYINGVLTAADTVNTDLDGSTMTDPSDRLVVVGGDLTGTTLVWAGLVYSAAVYDSVIDASQVAAMYNSGNGRDINLEAIEGSISQVPIHYHRIGIGTTQDEFGVDHGTAGDLPLDRGTAWNDTDLDPDIPDGT